jgi:nucleoside-diphosphate-sugar epimerase
MKILITGGTGFVGKHFVKNLAQMGWDLVLLTRNRANVPALPGISAKIYEGDVTDPEVAERIISGEKRLDGVFHLAASLVYFCKRQDIYRFNVGGTKNVLRIAERTGVTKFVYASSIEAAGGVRGDEVPARTDRNPHPISSYGWSKVQAESEVRRVANGKFKAAILRIGNVYGTDHLNFITFIADSILNRSRVLEFLPYYSDRYIQPAHNQDVANGLIAAYKCNEDIVTATLAGEYATIGEIFDICAKTMNRRYRMHSDKKIVDLLYLKIRREYHRYQGGGGDFISYMMAGRGKYIHRAYSLVELTDVIGYKPQFSLADGIRDTLSWARSNKMLIY